MNELKEVRKKLDITQFQAAKACNVSLRTYQSYEEANNFNSTYDKLLQKLKEIGIVDGTNHILSINFIKKVCRDVFSKNYPEISSAYLFGSYARGEATGKSDVDILVVTSLNNIRFFGIESNLESLLHKEVDVHSHRQLTNNELLLKQILDQGIKIYG